MFNCFKTSAFWLRCRLPALLLFASGLTRADVPQPQIAGNPDITTIWVVGDIDIVARAFTIVAMLFNSNTGSMLISAIQLAILISLVVMAMTLATTGKIDTVKSVMVIIFLALAIVPSTPVYVASYYDQVSGPTAGAVKFRKVDNIPVGVAWTLGLFSKMGKSFTEGMDTASTVVPDTAWMVDKGSATGPTSGGLSIHGTQGFFSPLRTLISLRRQYNTPENALIMANMATAARTCGWSDRWGDVNSEGFLKVLTSGHQAGMTEIMVPSTNPGERALQTRMDCATAGKVIAAQVLQKTALIPGKEYSPTAEKAVSLRNMSGDSGTSVDVTRRLATTQEELNQLPSALASVASGGNSSTNPNPNMVLATAYSMAKNQGYLNAAAMAQYYAAGVQIDAASIQASAIFNNVAQRCIGARDVACEREAYIMSDAITSSAVDAAGEASIFQKLAGGFLNLMLFLYVVLTPFMVFMIVIRGWLGLRLLGAYIMLAAWINSWLPLDAAIAHYMQQNLVDNLYKTTLAVVSSGNPNIIMSPTFTNSMFDSIQNMILTGSSLMAYIPTLIFFLLSGSAYGFAQIANRANLVGQNAVRQDLEAPPVDTAAAIGATDMVRQSMTGGPTGDPARLLSHADANSSAAISLSSSLSEKDTALQSVSDQLSKIESDSGTITWANTKDYATASESGYVLSKDMNDNVQVRFVEAGEKMLKDGERFVISGDANLSAGLQVAGTGGGGAVAIGKNGSVDSSLSYSDSQSVTQGFDQSTRFSEAEKISTRFGDISSEAVNRAVSQTVSDLRSDQNSLSQATDSTLASGASASIDHKTFNGIGVSYDSDRAAWQFERAIGAAGQHDAGVAHTLQETLEDGNNGSVFNKLLKFSNGSESQQMAATAALRSIFNDSDQGAAQPYAAMLESRMDVLEHTRGMRHDIQSRLDGDIAAGNAAGIGGYAHDRGIGASTDAARAKVAGADGQIDRSKMTLEESRKVMEYNAGKRQAAAEELMSLNEKLRLRTPVEKLTDVMEGGKQAAMANLAKDWEEGNYLNIAARMTPLGQAWDSIGADRSPDSPYQAGSNYSADPQVQQMLDRKKELEKQLDNHDPDNARKTFDGTPVERIIGRSLAPAPAAVPSGSAAADAGGPQALSTDKEGLPHLSKSKAFAGEQRTGFDTHEGTLAVGHAMMGLFDDSKHHDVRFSAFNDEHHAEKRPRSLHTKGLAVDMVLDQEDRTGQALPTHHRKWEQAEANIASFMADNGFTRGSEYRVNYEPKGVNGSTGDHIHFEFRSQAIAERFANMAENGLVKGLGSADGSGLAGNMGGADFGHGGTGFAAPLKNLIIKGEGDYHSVNLGQRHGERSDTRNLSAMTVNEVMQAQARREFNAVGRYQMIRETFKEGVSQLGLSGKEHLTPVLQERFFHEYLLKKAGGGGALNFIHGRHSDVIQAMTAMAKEWASFPVPVDMMGHNRAVKAGESYYASVGSNKAHLSIAESRDALQEARTRFLRGKR